MTVQADANQSGVDAVILHNGKPIEYVSCALLLIERDSWAQIVCGSARHFVCVGTFQILHVRMFKHNCGNRPQASVSNKKSLNAVPKRRQRMLLKLQRYDFQLVYRPGMQVIMVDTLSDEEQMVELRMVASEKMAHLIRIAVTMDDPYQ